MGLTVLGSDMAKKITVLDAIHMAVEAWGKVKQSTYTIASKSDFWIKVCRSIPLKLKFRKDIAKKHGRTKLI